MKLHVFLILTSLLSINAGVFECTDDVDCAENAICDDKKCTCPLKQILNLKGTKCLDLAYGFEESCEDDNQCGLLGGSYKCDPNVGKCVCAKGWIYSKGICIEHLKIGDPCDEHDDCFDGINFKARTCIDEKCACNVGYYDRQGYDCRQLRNPGEACSIHLDCKDSTCNYGVCAATTSNAESRGLIEDDSDMTHRFAEDCDASRMCTGKNMYCSPLLGKCLCKKGYFLNGVDCHAELGTRCEEDTCHGIGKVCGGLWCLCGDTYFQKPGNRQCTKGPFAPFFDCIDDISCAIFGENSQCKDNNLEKKCSCLKGYKLNENFLCEPTEGGGVKCKEDGDCDITNSICASTGACICPNNTIYDELDESCNSRLGGVCKTDYDCKKVDFAACDGEGKCSCMKNYVEKSETECVEVSTGLDGRCKENLECSGGISNSMCLNQTCVCEEGYIEIRKACLPLAKRIGDYCSHGNMCPKEMRCRKSSCQCDNTMYFETLDGCKSRADSPYNNFLFVLILCLILFLL